MCCYGVVIDESALAADELVTNALRHGQALRVYRLMLLPTEAGREPRPEWARADYPGYYSDVNIAAGMVAAQRR